MHGRLLAFALGSVLVGAATPVLAGFDSAYTDINLDDCTVTEESEYGSVWACEGYKGVAVRIAEGDLRYFVSYGRDAEAEPAAGQTPPPFNYLGPRIEWRLTDESGGWTPFATIVRYFVNRDGQRDGQVLVVTQIVSGATCHIAYVDALANPDPNILAREIADEMAGAFDCLDDPMIIGEFEAWGL